MASVPKITVQARHKFQAASTFLQSGDEPGVERIVRGKHVFDLGDDDALCAALAHEACEIEIGRAHV